MTSKTFNFFRTHSNIYFYEFPYDLKVIMYSIIKIAHVTYLQLFHSMKSTIIIHHAYKLLTLIKHRSRGYLQQLRIHI